MTPEERLKAALAEVERLRAALAKKDVKLASAQPLWAGAYDG